MKLTATNNVRTPTLINTSWREIGSATSTAGYQLLYRRVGARTSRGFAWIGVKLAKDETSYDIRDVLPDQEYEIFVKALDVNGGTVKQSNTITLQTLTG